MARRSGRGSWSGTRDRAHSCFHRDGGAAIRFGDVVAGQAIAKRLFSSLVRRPSYGPIPWQLAFGEV